MNMCRLVDYVPVLPRDAKLEISKKSGVSYPEVTRMFRGLVTKETPKVIEATKQLLKERGIMLDPEKFGKNALQEA